ncbi:MAG: 1,6-anhydro-N-acetylmuramyl-L-alanine amidase AmpD [Gammaproteobacteria bacterium]|nr:1,6-anhydro-N-acetylmuramyl-L-alanine amidase AmpD [Gammaproteobacteria bacterium]MDH5730682.1 1,6-anhydro-N-acetylmuramyl-L-alanine amidase AmpD [Gammaproteobacteria bacterium]
MINKDTGLIDSAEFILSPNHDDRANETDISLLIIHGISLPPGKFGGPYITDLFTNQLDSSVDPFFEQIKHLRVSSHLLIRRDGSVLQYVPFHKRAWHAGQSNFMGRDSCNDFSIGIELEGTDEQKYEDIQYVRLIEITRDLQQAYPAITADHIIGHCHVAPGRKTDPGDFFDWDFYKQSLD